VLVRLRHPLRKPRPTAPPPYGWWSIPGHCRALRGWHASTRAAPSSSVSFRMNMGSPLRVLSESLLAPGHEALGLALGGGCAFGRLLFLCWPLRHHQRPQPRIRRQHPVNRIRCSRGRGISAASRCMNSSGGVPLCVVPSRHGVLSLSSTCPAALHCTRSSDRAGRVMWRHTCSSRLRSCASQRTARQSRAIRSSRRWAGQATRE